MLALEVRLHLGQQILSGPRLRCVRAGVRVKASGPGLLYRLIHAHNLSDSATQRQALSLRFLGKFVAAIRAVQDRVAIGANHAEVGARQISVCQVRATQIRSHQLRPRQRGFVQYCAAQVGRL